MTTESLVDETVLDQIREMFRKQIQNVREYGDGNSWEIAGEDHMVNLLGNLCADISVLLQGHGVMERQDGPRNLPNQRKLKDFLQEIGWFDDVL